MSIIHDTLIVNDKKKNVIFKQFVQKIKGKNKHRIPVVYVNIKWLRKNKQAILINSYGKTCSWKDLKVYQILYHDFPICKIVNTQQKVRIIFFFYLKQRNNIIILILSLTL